jgi:hypothetical protein
MLDWNTPRITAAWEKAESAAHQLDQLVSDRQTMAKAVGGDGGRDNELYAVALLPEPSVDDVLGNLLRDQIGPFIREWKALKQQPVSRWLHLTRSPRVTLQLATPGEVTERAATMGRWHDAITAMHAGGTRRQAEAAVRAALAAGPMVNRDPSATATHQRRHGPDGTALAVRATQTTAKHLGHDPSPVISSHRSRNAADPVLGFPGFGTLSSHAATNRKNGSPVHAWGALLHDFDGWRSSRGPNSPPFSPDSWRSLVSHNWGTSRRSSRLPKNWKKIRAQVLARDPLCRICGVRPSVVADHIVPMTDDHRLEALQGVCEPCHRQKTACEAAAARAVAPRPTRKREPEAHPGLID